MSTNTDGNPDLGAEDVAAASIGGGTGTIPTNNGISADDENSKPATLDVATTAVKEEVATGLAAAATPSGGSGGGERPQAEDAEKPATEEPEEKEDSKPSPESDAAIKKPESESEYVDGEETNRNESEIDPRYRPRKRIRRAGKTPARKVVAAEQERPQPTPKPPVEIAPRPNEVAEEELSPLWAAAKAAEDAIPKILSKHDEKWNNMYDKLVQYKNQYNTTKVPQYYDEEPRLGRWVHYQRVEYWIYQQTGNAKITPERIGKLESIGFEWDPQKAQWDASFQKLLEFKAQIGHCKVPKGYSKDKELANWVRNQRLEHANMVKGKRTRMTEERFNKLDALGFKWSQTAPPKNLSPNVATNTSRSSTSVAAASNQDGAATAVAGPPAEEANQDNGGDDAGNDPAGVGGNQVEI